MINEFTLTLNSPITEEQWDTITDVDFEHTNEITFHTKHGKEVVFVKKSAQPEPCGEMVSREVVVKFFDDWMSALDINCHHQSVADLRIIKGDIKNLPSSQPEIIRCKDCKYFELDHFEKVGGVPIPIIVAHEICMKWGEGCKSSIDGWCFMAERRKNG